ncbi:MAG: porin family protein, partial [Bacteroides sp.]|nr:porin family protein [Bacteroides sp.]
LPGFSRIVDDEKGLTAGIGLGLGQLYDGDDSYVMIQPKIGYRFNQRVEAGVMARVDVACFHRAFYDTITALSYGGYINYNYLFTGPFSFFVSGRAMHIGNEISKHLFEGAHKPHSTGEYGITPGLRYKLRSLPIELTLNYIFIGYMDYKDPWDYKDAPGCWGSRWVLDMGLRRLEIGAAVTF